MSVLRIDESITAKTFILAERERVFHTLTTAEGWDAWFTSGMKIDARPGGLIQFRWEQFGPEIVTTSDSGIIQEICEPALFSFTWHPAGKAYPVLVRIELREAYNGTMVSLISRDFPNTERGRFMFMDCAVGWGEALTLLKFYLEYGVVSKGPVATAMAAE